MFRKGDSFFESSLEDLDTVAEALISLAGNLKVWIFFGEMGSGKTTLIKSLCRHLGVSDTMSSPTFSIVNEYLASNDTTIFHFDFYRIKNEEEAYDIGTDEYFYSGNYCFVEWPEKIPSLIPDSYVKVSITSENETRRTIAVAVHDREEKNRV
jgi:tRNA threonylcarbamoyladenosine biosynthesis protein TsaE